MLRERAGHTLPPTAVVHEAVIRLLGQGVFDQAADRKFLFASAAWAMREVLIDRYPRAAAARRGGGMRRVPLDSVVDYRTCSIVISVRSLSKSAERSVFRNAVTQRLRGRRPFRSLSHYGNGTAPPRAGCFRPQLTAHGRTRGSEPIEESPLRWRQSWPNRRVANIFQSTSTM